MPTAEPGGESFGEFVAAALPVLLRFGHVLTGNGQEAEDLVQEALAKSMRRWRRAGPDDPVAYVRKVMVNTHVTRWRRWEARVQLGDVPESGAHDKGLQRSHDWDALRRALAGLPPRQRAVLVLRYLEDLPDPAIADLLGCSRLRSAARRREAWPHCGHCWPKPPVPRKQVRLVALDDAMEERLRELLRDPGWSLPSWPDPVARVRMTVRRQRIRVAGLAAGASAVAAAVIVVSLAGLLPGSTPSASRGLRAKPPSALALPAVGAAGFPASVYPPAVSQAELNLIRHCPDPAGLEPLSAAMSTDAWKVVGGLGHSFSSDLRLTDRVYWPQVQSAWRAGTGKAIEPVHVLYSGPLESQHQVFGPPDLSRPVRSGCGNRTARDTWLVVTGQLREPGLQSEFLLVDRRGHLLVWNAE